MKKGSSCAPLSTMLGNKPLTEQTSFSVKLNTACICSAQYAYLSLTHMGCPIRVYSYGTLICVWDNTLSHISMSYSYSYVFYFAFFTCRFMVTNRAAAAAVAIRAHACMAWWPMYAIYIGLWLYVRSYTVHGSLGLSALSQHNTASCWAYAYGIPICVWNRYLSHTRMGQCMHTG